ncbi:MAG: hypothetical protein B6I20_04245 [Bacteroidetes bacterium 4572_117]|nr:MAG: hypothetical protein B6I20_04245 [Bacteroidetes bacterium 4572_117]
MKQIIILINLFLFVAILSCNTTPNDKKPTIETLFDTLLCKGFDFPVGNKNAAGVYKDKNTGKRHNGWYKAVKFCEKYSYGIHPAEDWNGNGGGNTDLGQKVRSIGKGIVVHAQNEGGNWGNTVVVEHIYYENGAVKKLRSLYAHLDTIIVKKGDFVKKRMQLGTMGNNSGMFWAHLHLELRKESIFDKSTTFWPSGSGKQDTKWIKKNYEHPTNFIKAHRNIKNPVSEKLLVIAIKHEYKLYVCKYGDTIKSIPIALGQQPLGHKQKEGDNRTPEGEYYINQKALGPFSGSMANFFGTAWMRISYPNIYDAKIGLDKGLITTKQYNAIEAAIKSKGMPPKNTAIGGGIGFHGWTGKWDIKKENNLTWGCVSINNDDLLKFYDLVQINTKLIIAP